MTKNFEELIKLISAHRGLTLGKIRELQSEETPAQRLRGYAMEAAFHVHADAPEKALEAIQRADDAFPVLPIPLFLLLLDLRYIMHEESKIPSDYLTYGVSAVQNAQYDLGCESLGTAFVEDADRWLKMVYEPETVQKATRCYEQVTIHLMKQLPSRVSRRHDKCRIGMLVANLVDDTVAYARRVMDFAHYIDRSRYELFVYSTENMCIRQHALPVRCIAQPSTVWAPRYLKELEGLNVPVFLASRELPVTRAALTVVKQMMEDEIDILIMQSGPTMPIDWLAARMYPALAKLHIHIGVPNYQKGMDVTIFDNQTNMEREQKSWPHAAGDMVLIRQGTDLAVIEKQVPMSRNQCGIPDDAVLIGVLSNHLDQRLKPDYLETISCIMMTHPQVWFVPIGQRLLPGRVQEFFREKQLQDRVCHIPVQRNPASALKILDVYANEFPVGGSQAVVEAMACGLPVAAIRWGTTHVESTGADIVGAPYAIETRNIDAYKQLIETWIVNIEQRRVAGDGMLNRAREHFSIKNYVKKMCDLAETIIKKQ